MAEKRKKGVIVVGCVEKRTTDNKFAIVLRKPVVNRDGLPKKIHR